MLARFIDSPKKKIAVIGGGFTGTYSVATLLEEGSFEPICFEKTDKIGGTWYYREESVEAVASIMPTTIINHSKEMGAISNFPPKKEYNNYMRHYELYQYSMEFIRSRGVEKYIQCNTEVVECRRTHDYEETGRWVVTTRNTISKESTTDVYDGVLVCVGHINKPKIPVYSNQEKFRGPISHTHCLKGVEKYRNKTVVVVGMGCSGLDAAVECSNVAKQVYLSTRSGAHVINRVGPYGYPFDYTLLRRYIYFLLDILPYNYVSWLFESLYLDPQFSQNLYLIKPKYHMLSKDPVLNDHIGSKLLSGSVKMKPDIKSFTEDGVIFEEESEVTKADFVIMATGYTWKFPFLEEGIIVQKEGIINLYKCIFPPHLTHSTLAVLGFILPFGPGFPLGELQCRWAVQVLASKCKLPTVKIMMKDIMDRHAANSKRYTPSEKMSIRVDFISYCDDIASQFGAKPNFLKMFFTDPRLYFKLMFGPSLSYQYRLQGPHAWDGAREAIMTSKDRMLWPLTHRDSNAVDENMFTSIFKKVLRLAFF
ncbi:dimethylaniline monooxygenase 5 [Nephila pilipes]|uniref:Flavin-containing monooxygenase n=1 Tax=Nephila pilipes TaxID=299642 RepID=A0A8X6PJF5_NEPPI|nr:dimethylaniline monooxygenase 5 [Nephila pilipes]